MSDTTTNPIDCHTGKDYLQQILVSSVERDWESNDTMFWGQYTQNPQHAGESTWPSNTTLGNVSKKITELDPGRGSTDLSTVLALFLKLNTMIFTSNLRKSPTDRIQAEILFYQNWSIFEITNTNLLLPPAFSITVPYPGLASRWDCGPQNLYFHSDFYCQL